MINEKDKANRIVKEFMTYFLSHNLTDITMHLKIDEQAMELNFTVPCQTQPSDFNKLLKSLNVPRQYELEEYYNSLLGAHHTNQHDYTFLGKALDEVVGEYKDGAISLWVKRLRIN